MSCILSDGTHSVDLQWGPEWGYQSSLTLGIRWARMTSGRYRCWDQGAQYDRWSSSWTHRAPASVIASLRNLVHNQARGARLTLSSSDGISPFGPLFDASAGLQVKVSPITPGEQIQNTNLRSTFFEVHLDQIPAVSLDARSMAPLLGRNRFSPSPETSWNLEPRVDGLGISGAGEDGYTTTVRARMRTADLSMVLRALLFLRGGAIGVSAAASPFGPGVPLSSGNEPSGYLTRCPSLNWRQSSADLWECSATLVRDP